MLQWVKPNSFVCYIKKNLKWLHSSEGILILTNITLGCLCKQIFNNE